MAELQVELAAGATGPFSSVTAVALAGERLTWAPAPLLAALGVTPTRTRRLGGPGGPERDRGVAWLVLRLGDRTADALVVEGDAGTGVVLGSAALEAFSLMVDPDTGELAPMPEIEE